MRNQRLLSLIRLYLNSESVDVAELAHVSDTEWHMMIQSSKQQKIKGLCLDAVNKLKDDSVKPPQNRLMPWIVGVVSLEKTYNYQKEVIKKLSILFSINGLKMVLLKGYGLSKLYHIPAHRGCGDLDIYFCGKGQYADELIKKLGIAVKQNEEKHSVYDYHGLHVENHASFISENEHPSLIKVENYLKKDLETNLCYDSEMECWIPSVMFNVVYLPLHFAGHFVYGGANLRQIVDYAMVVKSSCNTSESNSIDWDKVEALSKDGGYFKFLCCLNGICIDYIGISSECFPNWPRNKVWEYRILNEILNPVWDKNHSICSKVKKYFKNRWKFQFVYTKENYLMGFLLRTHSWLNWKWGSKKLWT